MHVHCHVCNIVPSICISVNCVEILSELLRLRYINLLFHIKLCDHSDVVVQNVNVISSPACKIVFFKKRHYVSPIKCFRLETFPFSNTINTIAIIITTLTIININFHITIIIITLSFIFNFFNIRGSCVTIEYEFICVLFKYFLLLFIDLRCNVLLTNIFIDLLLLALIFWNILILSTNKFLNLSYAITLIVDCC